MKREYVETLTKPRRQKRFAYGRVSPESYYHDAHVYVGRPKVRISKFKRGNNHILENKDVMMFIPLMAHGIFTEFDHTQCNVSVENNVITVNYKLTITCIDEKDALLNPAPFHHIVADNPFVTYYTRYVGHISGTYVFKFGQGGSEFVSNEWQLQKPRVTYMQGDGTIDNVSLRMTDVANDVIRDYRYDEINPATEVFYQMMSTLGVGLMDETNEFQANLWCAEHRDLFIGYM